MPTKAKKTVEKDEKIELEKSSKRASTKKSSSTTTKKASSKTKTTTSKKAESSKTKTASKKKTTTTKKKTATTTRKRTTAKKKVATPTIEYYDLPYRYNETIVKVLAQTPKSLFVYWDISDSDRENLTNTFGENFFNDTIPFLRITNENNGSSFDVDIDDFANGWYVPIEDAKCTYSVALLRKQRPFRNKIVEYEIYLTTSNKIEAPNDRILFNPHTATVVYKNVKSNVITYKPAPAIATVRNYYKENYKNENIEEIIDFKNPSSSFKYTEK